MAEIGKINNLRVARSSDFGLFLDGGDLGDILMPNRYVDKSTKIDDRVDVFIMLDSEDRLTATTENPLAMVDEFACLRVVATTPIGAFLDWGLPKDLLVPFREQKIKLVENQSYVVRVYLDESTGRIAASTKLDRYLDKTPATYTLNEEVDLMICEKTDLGYKAIINDTHWGMIFHNDVFQPLKRGQQLKGFIKEIRPDGKINLSLHKPGYEKVTDLTDIILEYLKTNNGEMPITNNSSPEEIYSIFEVSKKTYKKAIGALYKNRLIVLEDNRTRLA